MTKRRVATLLTNFNTSHVNVNLNCIRFAFAFFNISIHLMLMLIINRYAELDKPFTDFNTSHVNVNLLRSFVKPVCPIISIHLMLMLIAVTLKITARTWYISIHLMLMLISFYCHSAAIRCDFNTSHVNVNRPYSFFVFLSSSFQYISC